MDTKTCTKCGETKPKSEFRYGQCGECVKKRNALYRENNAARIMEKNALYRQKNNDRIKNLQAQNKEKYNSNRRDKYASSSEVKDAIRLTDRYVASILTAGTTLRSYDVKVLIPMKREQLKIYRITKQLKQEIKNVK